MKKIALCLIIPFVLSLNASDISQGELISFVAQKYKVEFNAQSQENKDKLKKEYEDTIKIVNSISKEIKYDDDLKVAVNLITFNIWSQKYMQNLKISDDILKDIYEKENPQTVATYNLDNILLNDKKKAEEIFNNLKKIDKNKRLVEFKKQVKIYSQDFITNKKDGNIGWIEIQKLDKNIQEKIKDKKKDDLILVEVENIGWQIILIEDYKPIKKATFEESKEVLTQLAKQQELIKRIDDLIK